MLKRYVILPIFSISLCLNSTSAAGQEDTHGSAYCNYIQLAFSYVVAKSCFPEDDPEFQQALNSEISRVEQFLRTEGPEADWDTIFQANKSLPLGWYDTPSELCRSNEAKASYERLKNQGPDGLRLSIDRILASEDALNHRACL